MKINKKYVLSPKDDLTAKELFHFLKNAFIGEEKTICMRPEQYEHLPDELKRHIIIKEGK